MFLGPETQEQLHQSGPFQTDLSEISTLPATPHAVQCAVHLLPKDESVDRAQGAGAGGQGGVEWESSKQRKSHSSSAHPLQFSDLFPPLPLSCKDSNSEIII